MRVNKSYIIISLLCLLSIHLKGSISEYKSFINIFPDPESSSVTSFVQDNDGMVWIGTNKGLYSYDGYNCYSRFLAGEKSNTRIYCMQMITPDHIMMGGDNGLLFYDLKKDAYIPVSDISSNVEEQLLPTDIRAILKDDGILWLGSLYGLFKVDVKTGIVKSFKASENNGLPHDAIYTIIEGDKDNIYIGTYNGLCIYNKISGYFTELKVPGVSKRSNFFVNSLLYDKTENCVWIGTEGELYRYFCDKNRFEIIEGFHDNSIKTMAHDKDGKVMIGTDNGLYIYGAGSLSHIVHDSRKRESLSNNIVWSIFSDSDMNMWIGTDYGISLNVSDSRENFIPVYEITGTGDGNHFYSVYKDKSGVLWLGGTNGLIRSDFPDKQDDVCWYKMGDTKHNLSHNRVRHIFEDSDNNLWVATDGSINRYDELSRKFIRYDIVDKYDKRNSNWAYNILEDNRGRLWIATCLGGIFVVNKNKLPASGEKYHAEYNLNKDNGLSGDFINQIVEDKNGDIWVLLYNNGVNKIDSKSFQVDKICFDENHNMINPSYLIIDKEGIIWCAYSGGVMYINPADNMPHFIEFNVLSDNGNIGSDKKGDALAMAEVDNEIWISASDGMWIVDKKTLSVERSGKSDNTCISINYIEEENSLYMGYANGISITTPDRFRKKEKRGKLALTALYVNNKIELSRSDSAVRYINKPIFTSGENQIVFEFSDLPYQSEVKSNFLYKLDDHNDDWNILPAGSNQITFNSLSYGDHALLIKREDDTESTDVLLVDFKTLPPLYLTKTAKTIYLILLGILVGIIINFIRVRNRLKNERAEKARVIEQTRQKMDFYANISHEFTAPLSNIIVPVSNMMISNKGNQLKSELETIQLNAMKINSMIHRIVEFDRIDTNYNSSLILSAVDIVELIGSAFEFAKEKNEGNKNQVWEFRSDCDSVIMNADVLKIESIINILLSNASKFGFENGKISLSIVKTDSVCIIEITDSGIGIPQKDQPYVTQRFFQASNNKDKKEGTGIGLYLAKMYTELHNGVLSISSVEGEGTSVIVSLPLAEIDQKDAENKNPEYMMLQAMQLMAQNDIRKKKQRINNLLPTGDDIKPMISADEEFLANVTSVIEDHIDDFELNVTSLCEHLDINNKQLYRKVKQLTGVSPVEYIKIIRMKKAAMLLKQNKFTVSEIVYMVGFSNASYFSKCFQNEFGQTPKSYVESVLS